MTRGWTYGTLVLLSGRKKAEGAVKAVKDYFRFLVPAKEQEYVRVMHQ